MERALNDVILVTGANRGLGLALVKAHLSAGDRVLGACRNPRQADELQALAKSHPGELDIIQMDVADDDSVAAGARDVRSRVGRIDVLVNNAAVGGGNDGSLETLDLAEMLRVLNINVLGAMRVIKSLLDRLRASPRPRVLNISSGLGAISTLTSCQSLSYGASKAALNYVSRSLAFDLKRHGIIVVSVGPGWMRTDMGGPDAPLAPETAANGIAALAGTLTMEHTSRWFNWDASEVTQW